MGFEYVLKFIICGDININCLIYSDETRQLDAVLLCYNLLSIINLPTRTQLKHCNYKITDCTFFPLISGLSDHEAQLLINGFKFTSTRLPYS